jgi:uncharacterized protein YjbI with pentapeptide repeats
MKPLAAALCALLLFVLCPNAGQASVPHDCTGCDFSGSHLAGEDFTGVVYIGANFANADLQHATFRHAKLVGANFRNADLRGADFEDTDCTGCNLQGARLDGAQLSRTDLTGADLSGFDGAVEDTTLRALLDKCLGCDLHNAKLAGRNLSRLDLTGIDFTGADLRRTNFDGAGICWQNTDRRGGIIDTECDDFRAAQVDGASFRNVQLCGDAVRGGNTCTPVNAATLREYTKSSLSGAILR